MKKTNLKAVRQAVPKKTIGKLSKKTTSKVPTIIQKADNLRLKNKADMAAWTKVVNEWGKKIDSAKTKVERRKVDELYGEKVKKLEAKEGKSYAAYYNYVHNNFTNAQCKAALQSSGNFMSKSYLNSLAKNAKKQRNF